MNAIDSKLKKNAAPLLRHRDWLSRDVPTASRRFTARDSRWLHGGQLGQLARRHLPEIADIFAASIDSQLAAGFMTHYDSQSLPATDPA
jgi:hypothetical protein